MCSAITIEPHCLSDGISNVWCVVTPPDYDGSNKLEQAALTWDGDALRYDRPRQVIDSGFVMTDEIRQKLGDLSLEGSTTSARPGGRRLNACKNACSARAMERFASDSLDLRAPESRP